MKRGRPPMPVGTAGNIHYMEVKRADGKTSYRAMCRFRDYDGVTRPVERSGPTKNAAKNRLNEYLRDRHIVSPGSEITAETKICEVADRYFAELDAKIEQGQRSPNSRRRLKGVWANYLQEAVGQLSVRELTTGRADKTIKTITTQTGAPTAKQARTILSGIMGLAAVHDALDKRQNPIRDVSKISSKKRKRARAFTLEELFDIRAKISGETPVEWSAKKRGGKSRWTLPERVAVWDLADLVDFFMGTGCRCSEALAAGWDWFDFDAETVEIRGQVIYEEGKGLSVSPLLKAEGDDWPTIELPTWVCNGLKERRKRQMASGVPNPMGLVFLSPDGHLRDPSNTRNDLRVVLNACGYEWASSHSWRKSVSTLMDEAGLSPRQIANQLRHANISTTLTHYLDRTSRSTGAKAVLEVIGGGSQA